MSSMTYEQETGFRKIPGDIWHELCTVCGDVVDIGWVVRHRRTHEAERRLIADLEGQVELSNSKTNRSATYMSSKNGYTCDYCDHPATDHAVRMSDGDPAPCLKAFEGGDRCDCVDFESEAADEAGSERLPAAEILPEYAPHSAFSTIVADPPWTPFMSVENGGAPKASPQRHYATLTTAQIIRLKPRTTEQAHLYLWAVASDMEAAYEVCRAWGFTPVILWTWVKAGLGVGRFRCNTEHVIVARKGSRHGNPFGGGGRHQQATAGTWFNWPRGRHSEKPDAFFDLVETLSPSPRLEMFARSRRLGWHSWGDEVDSDVQLA